VLIAANSRARASIISDVTVPIPAAFSIIISFPPYRKALNRMQARDEIIVISTLHRAERNVTEVRPRGDRSRPLRGLFSTRSQDRPNPFGLHRVKVLTSFRIVCASARPRQQRGPGRGHETSARPNNLVTSFARPQLIFVMIVFAKHEVKHPYVGSHQADKK